MIFCRTKIECDNLESFLKLKSGKQGALADTVYSCVVVHGDRY